MGRMKGVEPKQASGFIRFLYSFARKKVGKLTGKAVVPEPIKVTAHHPRLLVAVAQMEMGQEAAKSVPAAIKTLASIKTAMQIGCPF